MILLTDEILRPEKATCLCFAASQPLLSLFFRPRSAANGLGGLGKRVVLVVQVVDATGGAGSVSPDWGWVLRKGAAAWRGWGLAVVQQKRLVSFSSSSSRCRPSEVRGWPRSNGG